MDYKEALRYIDGTHWFGSKPGLERTEALLEGLGRPQDGLKFVHIAGTNGKGSCAAMLASILRAAGYKTGLYTSPGRDSGGAGDAHQAHRRRHGGPPHGV